MTPFQFHNWIKEVDIYLFNDLSSKGLFNSAAVLYTIIQETMEF
jgi:hypothetical protein